MEPVVFPIQASVELGESEGSSPGAIFHPIPPQENTHVGGEEGLLSAVDQSWAQSLQRAQVAADHLTLSLLEEPGGLSSVISSQASAPLGLAAPTTEEQPPFQEQLLNMDFAVTINPTLESKEEFQLLTKDNFSLVQPIDKIQNATCSLHLDEGFPLTHSSSDAGIVGNIAPSAINSDIFMFSAGKHQTNCSQEVNSILPVKPKMVADESVGKRSSESRSTYAQVVAPRVLLDSIPRKGDSPECGILLERIRFTILDDYVMAIERVTGRNSVVFIGHSPGSNDHLLVFLDNPQSAVKVVSVGIMVKRRWVCVSHFQEPATRVVISDVLPFIQDCDIINACLPFGKPVFSFLRRIPAATRDGQFKHVLSFRRELFINLKSPSSLPEYISIFSNGKVYKLSLSTMAVFCSKCKSSGHHFSKCPLSKVQVGTNQVSGALSQHDLPKPPIVSQQPQTPLPISSALDTASGPAVLVSIVSKDQKKKKISALPDHKETKLQKQPKAGIDSSVQVSSSLRNPSPSDIAKKRIKLTSAPSDGDSIILEPKDPSPATVPLVSELSALPMEQGSAIFLDQFTAGSGKFVMGPLLDRTAKGKEVDKNKKLGKKKRISEGNAVQSLITKVSTPPIVAGQKPRTLEFCADLSKLILGELRSLKSSKRLAVISSYFNKYPDLADILELAQTSPLCQSKTGQTLKSLLNLQHDLSLVRKSQDSRPTRLFHPHPS